MLAEMIFTGILQRKYAEEFSFQFCNEFFIFDNIVFLIFTNMYLSYVFFCNGDCITDKENRLRRCTAYVIITGSDIAVRKIHIKIQSLALCRIAVI